MNKFYFIHRNIGTTPDTNKYYFSSVDELINQVELLKNTEKNHIRWSVSKNGENNFHLMSDFWTTEERGTDIPLKCKGWWVCGFIFTDETDKNIYDLFPKWEADYTNHFIERRYMSLYDYTDLSDLDKEKCIKDGGIILNKRNIL